MKDDLDKYVSRRKRSDNKFAKNFESGYQEFRVGVLLRQAREQAGLRKKTSHLALKGKSQPFRGWKIMPKTCVCPLSNALRTPWAKALSLIW
jgi:hypothetical protein